MQLNHFEVNINKHYFISIPVAFFYFYGFSIDFFSQKSGFSNQLEWWQIRYI